MRQPVRTIVRHYGLAVLSVAIALAVRLVLFDQLGGRSPFLTFFPAVVITAYYGGLGPGLTCSVLSGLVASYFRMGARAVTPTNLSQDQAFVSDFIALILFEATCV